MIERLKAVEGEKSEPELLSETFNVSLFMYQTVFMICMLILQVASLISPVISGPYFSYHGSLTTPGCNEVVHWIIFKNTLNVSSSQV